MTLMERYQKALDEKNEAELNDILHDDFKFTMHASGSVLSKSDIISWAMTDLSLIHISEPTRPY